MSTNITTSVSPSGHLSGLRSCTPLGDESPPWAIAPQMKIPGAVTTGSPLPPPPTEATAECAGHYWHTMSALLLMDADHDDDIDEEIIGFECV